MKKYLIQKIKGCEYLVNLNKKKINRTHILEASRKVGISFPMMERAWNTFVQTGGKSVDKSCNSTSSSTTFPKLTRREKQKYTKARVVSAHTAAQIILEYMTNSSVTSTAVCNNNRITVQQFYKWIEELNISGKLLDEKVLNPKKYAKINVLDVIWLYKHPNTKRKSIKSLSEVEKLAYKRVGDVLVHYLSEL